MAMLADLVELVIGVDTHKDTHTAAVVQAVSGAVVTQVTVPATPAGCQQLLGLAERQPGRRVWAIEALAAMAPASPASWLPTLSRWWSWTGPSEPPAATAPSPIPWTPPGPPARP